MTATPLQQALTAYLELLGPASEGNMPTGLGPGASQAQIEDAQTAAGVILPPQLSELYGTVHPASGTSRLFLNVPYFMSLEFGVEDLLLAQEAFFDNDEVTPFPFATDNGSVLVVNCGEANYGSVWMWSSATIFYYQVADDLAGLFESMAQQLRIGGYHWNPRNERLETPLGYSPDRIPGDKRSIWSRTS